MSTRHATEPLPSEDRRENDAQRNVVEELHKDVRETGQWGYRNPKEVWIAACVVLLLTTVVLVPIVLHVGRGPTYPEGKTKVDPISGKRVSAYELPPIPNGTLISDQKELDKLLSILPSYGEEGLSVYATILPESVSDLVGKDANETEDPYIRAASWLTTVDSTNIEEYSVIRFALAAIYFETNGVMWTNSTNWLSAANHCAWHGIHCCPDLPASSACQYDDFHKIVQINLHNNNLEGSIPKSIAMFDSLQSLLMSNNKLTGQIHGPTFKNLGLFQKLYLQHNQLSGTIPLAADLDASGVLDTLYVQGNNLNDTLDKNYCGKCPQCRGKLVYFGIDCHKITCQGHCCFPWEHCFYHE